jgi:hypothetical protein
MDLLNTFELYDNELIASDDVLIALDADWKLGDSYQIIVNNTVREIEYHKVSPCGLVLFADNQTKQITVVSLSHNKSGDKYRYQGKIITKISISRHDCSVIAFSDSKTLHFSYYKPKTKRKESITEQQVFDDTPANRKLTEKMFSEKTEIITQRG